MTESSAYARLLDGYNGLADSRGGEPAAVLGEAVPEELLLAAGLKPLRVRPSADTPPENEVLELAFDEAAKRKYSVMTAQPLPKYLIVSNSGDSDIKLYYYLRELARTGRLTLPECTLLDWFYTDKPLNHKWNRKELTRFLDLLAEWGHPVSDAALAESIRLCEADREALRRLLSLRRTGRVSGTEALVALGSSLYMDKAEHRELVLRFCDEAEAREPLPGKRLLLLGSPVDDTRLYALLESRGWLIAAETHALGASLAAPLPEADDALSALEARLAPGSKRSLPDEAAAEAARLCAESGAEEAILFSWLGDEAYSWDVPALKEKLPVPLTVFDRQSWDLSELSAYQKAGETNG